MKAGRPGKRRHTHGRIRAAIPPELKDEILELVEEDVRFYSFARFIEIAMTYYLEHYKTAQGDLDKHMFPRLAKK